VNVIISCHLDSVFTTPFADWQDGVFRGACDNFAGVLAMGYLVHEMPDLHIEFTESEETTMDGARQLARIHKPDETLFIVIDVTDRSRGWKSIHFTIENYHRIQEKHIRQALKSLRNKYKLKPLGTESEAWLYKDKGFPTLEVDVPVMGGLHNLQGVARGEDIWAVSEATKLLAAYFQDKTLREIEGEID
jgi:putative aminopeptidase FrvX